MTIRSKIIYVFLPLLVVPLILTLLVGVLSTRNGITHIATKQMAFKSRILMQFMESQWQLLESNGLSENTSYVSVSKKTIEDYAVSLIENREELIFAFNEEGMVSMITGDVSLDKETLDRIRKEFTEQGTTWVDFTINRDHFVSDVSSFAPFGWIVVNAVQRDFFFGYIMTMVKRILLIFLFSMAASVLLLIVFSGYISRPLLRIAEVIRKIIETNDLSLKVDIFYDDEIGEIGHYFNIMTRELEMANDQMKNYALKAVVSKRNEMKIRNIFQKYVPKDVIDRFYFEPESMLEGDSRVLGILFSDIRKFTTFSEKLPPHEVVESLNKYFEYMVDIIMSHHGIVDKYIGDAIMAFFGAPVHHENDALEAAKAGLSMLEKVSEFNIWQSKYNRQPFHIGVGINYGYVTVGNIGTEKKMDYTVIGDMVNLASRLESLTKFYSEAILISDSVHMKVRDELPCRHVDRVVVKGKTEGTNIYTVRNELSEMEKELWLSYDDGISHYYKKEFKEAAKYFQEALKIMPKDFCSLQFLKRCQHYLKYPTVENWSGAVVLQSK